MKKLNSAVLFFFFSPFGGLGAFAQNPLVKQWDYRFGGTDHDWTTCFQQTKDGGYILGGYSYSGIGGDKTDTLRGGAGDRDYWIVKTDSLGNKEWDKDFGGTGIDELFSLQQTADRGYILGGHSYSGIGGDKTDSLRGGTGDVDYWIIKTDSLGNKEWDKDFGGTNADGLYSLQQTADGGYILGGLSGSVIGGDKTQATWGNYDYWIIKTDSLGNKEWDKDFGGTDYDVLSSLQQTADGGYILGGWSGSGIGGDKTQSTWGADDYWIIKTDSLGNKEWDKDFGGTITDVLYSLQQTADGGYILGGYSDSWIGGDKTQATWGSYDYWIVKTDSVGSKEWDKDFGGTLDEDEFGNVSQTKDGGYLIAGTSYSNISGDKTENNSLGTEQTWIVKTDSQGAKQWDKTILSPGHDEQGYAIQSKDGCYAVASWDNGGIGGYKTQAAWGGSPDYWIVKFCDTTFRAGFTSTPNLCPGTCTDFVNHSFNATSYQWYFPGATPATSTANNPTNICYQNSGSYDVQLIATNTNGSDTLLLSNYITVYPSPAPQAIAQSGDTLFANAGANSYQWYYNTTLINGATDYFYLATGSGDYNVVAADGNGCEVEAVIFNVVAGLESMDDSGQLTVFPNPVGDKVRIQIPIAIGIEVKSGTSVEISIYNVVGEKVWNGLQEPKTTNLEVEINVSQLVQGIYFLELSPGDKTFRAKFVKQ
ncbi:MAG: T9SS type A sorting domain-containing protein [Bacteroidota bacterium]